MEPRPFAPFSSSGGQKHTTTQSKSRGVRVLWTVLGKQKKELTLLNLRQKIHLVIGIH
jgi:hypothetical protein